jgi:arylsulfatase A-like enzyme
MNRVGVKTIFDVLSANKYDCSMFYSSSADYTGFRDFLNNRDIDEMYDADTMPGERKTPSVSWGLHEDETLRAIQNRIKQYAAERQKFFLTYIPAAPHNPFDGTPARFRKHQKENFNDFTPLYLNELLYMDWVIASICDQLKESGLLENTLVVITSDHGEMLGANGGPIGHGWAVNPELTNIPLIIMDPAHPQFRLNSSIGSQVDLLPTIAKRLGISLPQDQLYQGKPLKEEETNRAIYLNSFREYGIIEGSRMTCGERGVSRSNDALELFPLTNRITSSVLSDAGSKSNQVPAIEAFDNFQENFLRNYAHYCEMMHAEKRTDF